MSKNRPRPAGSKKKFDTGPTNYLGQVTAAQKND